MRGGIDKKTVKAGQNHILIGDNVKEEYKLARKQKRQPYCPFCKKPLVIRVVYPEIWQWEWDKDVKDFAHYESDGKPEFSCLECGKAEPLFKEFLR